MDLNWCFLEWLFKEWIFHEFTTYLGGSAAPAVALVSRPAGAHGNLVAVALVHHAVVGATPIATWKYNGSDYLWTFVWNISATKAVYEEKTLVYQLLECQWHSRRLRRQQEARKRRTSLRDHLVKTELTDFVYCTKQSQWHVNQDSILVLNFCTANKGRIDSSYACWQ